MKNKYSLILLLFLFTLCSPVFGQQPLKILSYNIHHGNPPSKPGIIDLEAIAKVIRTSGADVVGLQEIDVNVGRSEHVDQAKKLAELAGMKYYFFSKGIDLEKGEYGTVILSKFPITNTERLELPMPVKSEMRSLGIAKIKIPSGKEILFANTHLDLKEENRIAQTKFIVNHFQDTKHLVVLVGDLNAQPQSEPIKILGDFFKRSEITNGFTIPEVNPNREIDFIMVNKSKNPKFQNHTVIEDSYASDHRPVYAELVIK